MEWSLVNAVSFGSKMRLFKSIENENVIKDMEMQLILLSE